MSVARPSDDRLRAAWAEYERHNHNAEQTSAALGMSPSAFKGWLRFCTELGLVKRDLGALAAKAPLSLPLPKKGEVLRYVLTSAQNNTLVDPKAWATLQSLASHYDAVLKVATFTYRQLHEGSAKRGTRKIEHEIWYDREIEPYVSDKFERLAPGLVWNGMMNTLPTAANPLTGFESFNGRDSGIFPHPKFAMESIATVQSDPAKFLYTTGCITKRNYIQKRAGILAEFHHSIGALLVEIDDTGAWWVRQLNADSQGRIFDLDHVFYSDGTYEDEQAIEALVCGDVHVANIDPLVSDVTWGPGGIVDTLRPKTQFLHDMLDFESRSHHNRKDPHEMYRLHVQGKESVFSELHDVTTFLQEFATRPGIKTVVVNSNHDRHLERWLKEVDWRDDLVNAEIYIDAQRAMLGAIRRGEEFDAFSWAIQHYLQYKDKTVAFLPLDASYIVCRDASGGIECGLHGDLGPNGSRGTARNLSRLGRKACIGHSHAARIVDGVYQAGVSAKLKQGYNVGPSNWSHSHILIHANGKRQIVTIWKGKWKA